MNIDSTTLRKRIADLETFMATEVFEVWQQSRTAEVTLFNEAAAMYAKSWEEVVAARERRDNTIDLQNSFQELSETLKTELDLVVEAETKIAGSTKV